MYLCADRKRYVYMLLCIFFRGRFFFDFYYSHILSYRNQRDKHYMHSAYKIVFVIENGVCFIDCWLVFPRKRTSICSNININQERFECVLLLFCELLLLKLIVCNLFLNLIEDGLTFIL